MAVAFLADDLRVGRDPNDAGWVVFRYPWEWQPPPAPVPPDPDAPPRPRVTLTNLLPDPARQVVELAPDLSALIDLPWEKIPLAAVTDEDGTAYIAQPGIDRLARRRPCDDAFTTWDAVGGRGIETGRLRTPLGLALDGCGFLYVAEAENRRVQVLRLPDGEPVALLGARDAWGNPVAGTTGGAMIEPVDVAIGRAGVFVLDRGAPLVHVFNRRFVWQRSFPPSLPAGAGGSPRPFALAVEPDGTLLVADADYPRLLHFGADGTALADVALAATTNPRFAGVKLAQRFVESGEAVVGPLDGGIFDAAWHEVAIDGDFPAGTRVRVQTYASNDPDADAAPLPWAPDAPVPIPLADEGDAGEGDGRTGEMRRLVLAGVEDPGGGRPPRATDRGQYLWLRLQLSGPHARPADPFASATPTLRGLRVLVPRPSYLQYLPAVYGRRDDAVDPPGAIFLERFLSLFESVFNGVEESYESVSSLLNLDAAPADWLNWIGSWLGLVFDPSWDLERRRALTREAVDLFRRRGTVAGLSRFVEVYLGKAPQIIEGFRRRPQPTGVLGASSVLGCTRLHDQRACRPGAVGSGAHRFALYAYVDDACARQTMGPVVKAIVDANKPSHTDYDLFLIEPTARVGLQSTVGVDFVLGDPPVPVTLLGEGARPGDDLPHPTLGRNLRLSPGPAASGGGVRLSDVSPPLLDDGFVLA